MAVFGLGTIPEARYARALASNNACRNHAAGQGLALHAGRASSCQLRSPCGIADSRNIQNNGRLGELWRNICQVLTSGREVCGRQVVLEVRGIALDQLAPLFIPEEECLLPVFVVETGDEERAAELDAEDVVVQLRTGSRGSRRVLVLLAVCIEGCVAVELP